MPFILGLFALALFSQRQSVLLLPVWELQPSLHLENNLAAGLPIFREPARNTRQWCAQELRQRGLHSRLSRRFPELIQQTWQLRFHGFTRKAYCRIRQALFSGAL